MHKIVYVYFINGKDNKEKQVFSLFFELDEYSHKKSHEIYKVYFLQIAHF